MADHLGSTPMEFSGGGWPVWSEDYAPYGQEIKPQATTNNYKFTGYERDPETGAVLFAHLYLLPQKGIYIIENLNLEELARDRCYQFAFVGIPLKFQGATGSPLRPLALV